MKSTTSFIAAAIAGVFAAGAIVSHAAPLGSTTAAEEKESCKGKDSCKGKEGCKGKEKKEDKKDGTIL